MDRLFSKFKYNQVVAYGDILGFKDFIIKNDSNNNMPLESNGLRCYVDVFHYLDTSLFTDEFRKKTGINFIWLSDSFSFAGDVSKWEEIKNRFINFSCELFCMGFIFRGAIAFGNMHNERNMMGKPLVDAVNIESSVCYPEVQLSQEALDKVPFVDGELYEREGKVFFDYLYVLFKQRIEKHCFISTFHVVTDVCFEGLHNEDRKVRLKYCYLLTHINEVINKLDLTDDENKKAIEEFKNKLERYNL